MAMLLNLVHLLTVISLLFGLQEKRSIGATDLILSMFDKLERKCYGNRTKKIGVCTLEDICHFGIYQPFLYVDEQMEIDGFTCPLGEICCTKGCLVKGYYVGICISRDDCLNEVYENFKTINNDIVFGEKCYFDDVCCI